jgi:Tfp pilus assembly protein PilN
MININLIAERRARRQREQTILRMSILGVLLVFLTMATLNLAWFVMLRTDHVNVDRSQANYDKSEKAVAEFLTLQDDADGKQKIVDLLTQVRVSEGAWMTILADVSRDIPAQVVLTNLGSQGNEDGVELHLSGLARDEETVGIFLRTISRNAWVQSTPTLGRVNYEEGNNDNAIRRATFDIIVPVNGLYGGNL